MTRVRFRSAASRGWILALAGLAAAAGADGFVVVPEALEGHPPGARVTVHLY